MSDDNKELDEKKESSFMDKPILVGKKEAIESSIYYLMTRQPFYGALLQLMNITYSQSVPTAALCYNSKKDTFQILMNEQFICRLTLEERIGVLLHEILHFTHGHVFRGLLKTKNGDVKESDSDSEALKKSMKNKAEHTLINISQDLAINCYIPSLPEGCMRVEKFKLDNGDPFPPYKTWEFYYEQFKNGKDKDGHNQKELAKYGASDHDIHMWDEMTEEDIEGMLQQAKKTMKRAIEKSCNGYSRDGLDKLEELLRQIDQQISGLNYKRILQQVVKKTISVSDRSYKWNRPNRRYGNFAPGSTNGEIPSVSFYIDTSGSISHTELNQFLTVMDGLLKVGQKKCSIGFWHTELYHKQKYRLGMKSEEFKLTSGGTDINCILKDLNKNPSNLIVVLTDGYFGDIDTKISGQVVWVISKGGTSEHPGKNIGITIPLDKVKIK